MSIPAIFEDPILLIPEYDDPDGPVAPGDPPIPPGNYTLPELVELLRHYKDQPEAIQFIADMLEP